MAGGNQGRGGSRLPRSRAPVVSRPYNTRSSSRVTYSGPLMDIPVKRPSLRKNTLPKSSASSSTAQPKPLSTATLYQTSLLNPRYISTMSNHQHVPAISSRNTVSTANNAHPNQTTPGLLAHTPSAGIYHTATLPVTSATRVNAPARQPVPCGMCTVLTDSNSIGCDQCPKWFHATPICTCLDPEVIDTIIRFGGTGIAFKCTDCRIAEVCQGAAPALALIQMNRTIKSLCTTINELKVDTSSNPTQGLAPMQSATQLRTFIREETHEIAEREKRKLSLIIRGIGGNDEQFLNTFRNLAAHLIGNGSFTITSYQRLSETMTRVSFDSPLVRTALISAASTLRNSTLSHVYIQKDLTMTQRKEQYERRQERRRLQPGINTVPPTSVASNYPPFITPTSTFQMTNPQNVVSLASHQPISISEQPTSSTATVSSQIAPPHSVPLPTLSNIAMNTRLPNNFSVPFFPSQLNQMTIPPPPLSMQPNYLLSPDYTQMMSLNSAQPIFSAPVLSTNLTPAFPVVLPLSAPENHQQSADNQIDFLSIPPNTSISSTHPQNLGHIPYSIEATNNPMTPTVTSLPSQPISPLHSSTEETPVTVMPKYPGTTVTAQASQPDSDSEIPQNLLASSNLSQTPVSQLNPNPETMQYLLATSNQSSASSFQHPVSSPHTPASQPYPNAEISQFFFASSNQPLIPSNPLISNPELSQSLSTHNNQQLNPALTTHFQQASITTTTSNETATSAIEPTYISPIQNNHMLTPNKHYQTDNGQLIRSVTSSPASTVINLDSHTPPANALNDSIHSVSTLATIQDSRSTF